MANVKSANEGRTRIFCFGIGTDVNTHLLDKITEETRAFSQYVLPEEDLEVKVSNFFSKIKEPVLANPTLKFTGDVRVTKALSLAAAGFVQGRATRGRGPLLRQGRFRRRPRRHGERRVEEVHLRSEVSRASQTITNSSRACGPRGASAICSMKSVCTARTPSCATKSPNWRANTASSRPTPLT